MLPVRTLGLSQDAYLQCDNDDAVETFEVLQRPVFDAQPEVAGLLHVRHPHVYRIRHHQQQGDAPNERDDRYADLNVLVKIEAMRDATLTCIDMCSLMLTLLLL